MEYFLFIDDTAIANKNGSNRLMEEKVSMVGCLIPIQYHQVFVEEIEELKKKYEVSEFHFTDIYNRKGEFKDFDSDKVLDVIEDFASLIVTYKVKIITQTITNEFLQKNPKLITSLDKIIDKLKLNVSGDYLYEAYALILNAILANRYLKDGDVSAICCDEGLMEANKGVMLPLNGKNIPLCFEDSKDEVCLQLADFSAWALSRSKQTLNKYQDKEMKDFEEQVMNLLSYITQYYLNLDMIQTDVTKGINIDEVYKQLLTKKKSN